MAVLAAVLSALVSVGAAFLFLKKHFEPGRGEKLSGVHFIASRGIAGIRLAEAVAFAAGILITAGMCILCISDPDETGLLRLSELVFIQWLMLTVTVTDLSDRIIPNFAVIAGFAVRIIFMTAGALSGNPAYNLKDSLIGWAAVSAVILVIYLTSKKGLGGGDVKLISLLALCFGLSGSMTVLFVSFALSAMFGGIMLASRKAGMKDSFPLAPFLFVGVAVKTLFELI